MPKPDKKKLRGGKMKEEEKDPGSEIEDNYSNDALEQQDEGSRDEQEDSEDDDDDEDETDDEDVEGDANKGNQQDINNGNNNQEHEQQQQLNADEILENGVNNDDEQGQNNNNNPQEQQLQQEENENLEGAVGGSNSGNDDRSSATNLIINYLPQDMTDRELYNLFNTCGSINTCKIMRDFKTGYSFGYGFVDYNAEVDSEEAIQKLNGFYVRNKRLKVSYARPGGQSIKDTNLYVINLSRNINEDQLDRIFSPFGLIVQRNILRDKLTGRPRGVAFVRFNKREEAQEAMRTLNNTIPEGGSQPIWVRLAEEHGKAKAAQFMSQIGAGGGGPQHMGQQQPPPPHVTIHMPQLPPHPHQQQQQQMHHQQHHNQQQHHQQQHHNQQQHHHQQQQHHHQHHNNHNLGPPPHHVQQLHHHPIGGGGGNHGINIGMPQPMHGGGAGVGGNFHHNMAHRAASHR